MKKIYPPPKNPQNKTKQKNKQANKQYQNENEYMFITYL